MPIEEKNELLSRSADYSHSIREIRVLVVGDLQAAARNMTNQELARSVELAIHDAASAYDELLADIAKDKLLLQFEVDQLREEILVQQQAISIELNRIRSAHEQFTRQMLGI